LITVPTVAALSKKIQQSQAAVKEKADHEMEALSVQTSIKIKY
jgi:hypothetical protein